MKEFVFFLKRDARLLVPINVINAILFTIMLVVASIIRMRVAEPFEVTGITAVTVLLFLYLVFATFFIIIESVWREWRLGIQHHWYLAPGSMLLKLLAKITANLIWLFMQSIFVTLFMLLFIYFAAESHILQTVFEESRLLLDYPLQLVWITLIAPVLGILMILLPVYLFLGIKTWMKYVLLLVYGILFVVVYPYIMFKIESHTEPESGIFFFVELTSNEQMLMDAGLLFVLLFITTYFLKKKIEL
ncbi:hypothetical protein [Shouchella lehensis]|uniref:Uncharacterized protein n=1 Tax=Shouchella lehensis G1 TaxID=1246626 RepID=A0A060LUN6_9BACI|nr:hypothetical protein [Shouchella lehensis]AIC93862.1 hypothetical protein BleG1_1279 [Shouchella lehensis G1]